MKQLARIELPDQQKGKGSTRHIRKDLNVSDMVCYLRTAKSSDDQFYLFYEDANGNDLNDLCFLSFGELLWQVANEFTFDVAKMLQADAERRFRQ